MYYPGVLPAKPARNSNVTLRIRFYEMPTSRTPSRAVGGSKVPGAGSCFCRELSCFPSLAKPASISVLWENRKAAGAVWEMLPEILIFKVCMLLVMMKSLAYSSQHQGKLTFLDKTSVENAREAGYTLGWLLVYSLASCQNTNVFYWPTISL